MSASLSPNTQAILLLTAPLMAGRGKTSADLLSPGEYKRLARHLRDMKRQPADLLSPESAELRHACQAVIAPGRMERLLARGFLLSQAIERWRARAIWVVSRADADYPRRLKARLREDAPAILYGCGDLSLLETGGLAAIGSRHVDDSLIDYTVTIGRLAAHAGKTLVSGGAKGIDQAAMRGALDAGGQAIGVLADSLQKKAMDRQHRNVLIEGRLVLVSPYDPGAGFNVGNAMRRNKLIYALADAALVVNSDFNKGGTWAGATEQLDKLQLVPVYVRSTGTAAKGLDALRAKGALPWPNPSDPDTFNAVFKGDSPSAAKLPEQPELPLFADEPPPADALPAEQPSPGDAVQRSPITSVDRVDSSAGESSQRRAVDPAEQLLATVRDLLNRLLNRPMNETEVADELQVSKAQARAWLQSLVDEGMLEKKHKPVRYVKQKHDQPTSSNTDERLKDSAGG